MKHGILGLALFLAAASASAKVVKGTKTKKVSNPYVGKCAKEAADLAWKDFGDVKDPDPNLEFDFVSSIVDAKDKSIYVVKYGEFDGNQGLVIEATIKVTGDCKQDGSITKKTVGAWDGD